MFAYNSPGSLGLNDYGALMAERPELSQPLSLDRENSDAKSPDLVPHLSLNLLTLFSSVWVTRATAHWSRYTVVDRSRDGKNAAYTYAYCPYKYKSEHGEKGLYRLKLRSTRILISHPKSWVVDGLQSDELLRHEQVHADIALLVAYEELRELAKLRAKRLGHLQDLISRIEVRCQQKADALTKFYDSREETDGGDNKAKQAEWEAMIDQHIHDEFAPLPDPPNALEGAGSH